MQARTENAPIPSERGGFKLKEAADYIGGVNTETVRRLIARGLLKPCRGLRHIIIAKSELDRFLASN